MMHRPHRTATRLFAGLVFVVLVAALPAAAGTAALRIGYPSVADFSDVPSLVAAERLRASGFPVETTFFAQPELLTQGVLRGDVDMGAGSITTVLAAIQRGAPLRIFMAQHLNEWSVMAVRSINSCKDLAGKRFAIHSEAAISTALVRQWLKESGCEKVPINFLVVPGSEVRAQALMAGQIDAAPAELSDSVRIQMLRPNDFHRIASFSLSMPELLSNVYYSTQRTLQGRRDVLERFIAEVLKVHREARRNPTILSEAALRLFPDADKKLTPAIAQAYASGGLYPVNGGLSGNAVGYTIDFLVSAGSLQPGLKADQVTDTSILDAVLANAGRESESQGGR